MKCPTCGRMQRYTESEKRSIMENGSRSIPCMNCGTVIVVHKYDVDKVEKRKHYAEIGLCSNCGKRPAVNGLKTCEKCRDYQSRNHEETKSTGYYDLFYRSKLPKKENVALDNVSKMAHDKGISYGEMVAIMEGRKREKKDLD